LRPHGADRGCTADESAVAVQRRDVRRFMATETEKNGNPLVVG